MTKLDGGGGEAAAVEHSKGEGGSVDHGDGVAAPAPAPTLSPLGGRPPMLAAQELWSRMVLVLLLVLRLELQLELEPKGRGRAVSLQNVTSCSLKTK